MTPAATGARRAPVLLPSLAPLAFVTLLAHELLVARPRSLNRD